MKIKLGNSVMVSDPCYTPDTWCQAKIENVKEGEYNTYCHKIDTGDFGERCSLLLAVHSSYDVNKMYWELHPDEIGVDSGQAGIFDMSTFRKDGIEMEVPTIGYDGRDLNWLDALKSEKDGKGEDWYIKMCKLTLTEKMWGGYENGVVSRSGFGDGGYTLYIAKEEYTGKVIGFCIDFFVEEQEETESIADKIPFLQ